MEEIFKKHEMWISSVKSKEEQKALKKMSKNEIADSFTGELNFGTAGIRGIMGLGNNRFNVYTVARIIGAYAQFLKHRSAKAVFIGYDVRENSELFMQIAASQLNKHNILVYTCRDVVATPITSFAIRKLQCGGGIMITSSHNTKEYNGIKIYNSLGAQVNKQEADEIEKLLKAEPLSFDIENTFTEGKRSHYVIFVDEIFNVYLDAVKKQKLNDIKNLNICYTALNGCGYSIIPKLIGDITQDCELIKVNEQCIKDGSFKTCPTPNPEHADTLKVAINYARDYESDIILATDPDADRLGVAVRHKGEYIHLTGNETGILMLNYIITERRKNKTLPKNPVLIKSIVTTPFVNDVAKPSGVEVCDTLTGFPSLADKMNQLAEAGREKDIILAFEESIGFLPHMLTRDKDGIAAVQTVLEMASEYKAQDKTLIDMLYEIYKLYGYSKDYVLNIRLDGKNAKEKIKSVMHKLRQDSFNSFGECKVISKTDYAFGVEDIPQTDMLALNLQEDGRVIVRPSGTEPLLKFYIHLKGDGANAQFKIISKYIQEITK